MDIHDDAMQSALADAIQDWMAAPAHLDYNHGYAWGIAKALSVSRGTTARQEWEAGLDRYQNRITIGEDRWTQ